MFKLCYNDEFCKQKLENLGKEYDISDMAEAHSEFYEFPVIIDFVPAIDQLKYGLYDLGMPKMISKEQATAYKSQVSRLIAKFKKDLYHAFGGQYRYSGSEFVAFEDIQSFSKQDYPFPDIPNDEIVYLIYDLMLNSYRSCKLSRDMDKNDKKIRANLDMGSVKDFPYDDRMPDNPSFEFRLYILPKYKDKLNEFVYDQAFTAVVARYVQRVAPRSVLYDYGQYLFSKESDVHFFIRQATQLLNKVTDDIVYKAQDYSQIETRSKL